MTLTIQLAAKDLTFLLHLLEASDGLAVLKTIDGKKGIAQLIYPVINQSEIENLLANFPRNYQLIKQ